MKSILIYLLLGLFFISHAGCSDDNNSPGEPIVWYQYFAFVDEEGNDFFKNNSYYTNVFLLSDFGEFEFEDSLSINDINVFGYGAWGPSIQYISFGNGDIDTLTKTWEPKSVGNIGGSFEKLESLTFHYNGSEIATWDFVQNPELFNELKERNKHSIARPTATDPIYIEIVKTANPNEFD